MSLVLARCRLRKAVEGKAGAGWSAPSNFLSKDNWRECGTRMSTNCLIAPWPRQSGGGMTSGAAARPASTAKGPAQILAQTRQQLAQAREQGMPEDCIRVLECEVVKEEAEMRQAQPMGQRTDQARARFRRVVEAGEKAQDAMLKAQANFEQAQQEMIKAQSDLHKLMQEAPLLVMPAPQVNMNLAKSLEALTEKISGIHMQDHHPTN